MNKLNYCELPSIPCSMRTGNSKSYFPEDKEYCSMFNRDQVKKFINENPQLDKYNICYQSDKDKVGDYKCHLNNNGRCIGKAIDCKSLEGKDKIKDDYTEIDINKDVLCMPPVSKDCKKRNEKKVDSKIYINGRAFYQCENNDPMCLSDIYSANKRGLPTVQNYSDPVNRKILYTKTYKNPIINKRIISCPNGYNVCGNLCCRKNDTCIPVETKIIGSPYPFCDYGKDIRNLYVDKYPKLGEFETERECLDWCAKNPDCKTVVRFLDRNGNLQCRYYRYDSKDNRIKYIDDKTSLIYQKRNHEYVPNPQI